jgi:hypothetical protein
LLGFLRQSAGLGGARQRLAPLGRADGAGGIAVDDPAQRRARLDETVAAGHPTYLTRELAGIETRYSFSGAGPLVRVWPRGQAQVETPPNSLPGELAGGALLFQGIENLFHHNSGGGFLGGQPVMGTGSSETVINNYYGNDSDRSLNADTTSRDDGLLDTDFSNDDFSSDDSTLI